MLPFCFGFDFNVSLQVSSDDRLGKLVNVFNDLELLTMIELMRRSIKDHAIERSAC